MSNRRETWSELKKKYPNKCIIYIDPVYEGDSFTCTVLDVCDIENRIERFTEILDIYPYAIIDGTS